MKKAALLIAIIIIAIIAAGFYTLYTPTITTVAISKVYEAKEGNIVEVNITVSNVEDLCTWVFDLAWDPYILRIATGDTHGYKYRDGKYYNIYEGPFLKSVRNETILAINYIYNDKGTISHIGAGYLKPGDTASGSGVLVTIQFECINSGTTTVEIVDCSVLQNSRGENIGHENINGLITKNEYVPPPILEDKVFQFEVIAVEIIALMIVSGVLVKKMGTRIPESEEEPSK